MSNLDPATPGRSYMLLVCAEHGLKLGYGDKGERLCPAGCVGPRAKHIVVVPVVELRSDSTIAAAAHAIADLVTDVTERKTHTIEEDRALARRAIEAAIREVDRA